MMLFAAGLVAGAGLTACGLLVLEVAREASRRSVPTSARDAHPASQASLWRLLDRPYDWAAEDELP